MERASITAGPLATPCWVSTYGTDGKGYAVMHFNGRNRRVHLVAYELLVGPVPAGLQVDHLCRVRACCNPAHLEAVTGHENFLRGMSVGAIAIRLNECRFGHSLADAAPNGDKRRCRTCRTAYMRQYYLNHGYLERDTHRGGAA